MITTERLQITNFAFEDLDQFLKYRNDAEVYKFQSWVVPFTKKLAIEFVMEMKEKSLDKMMHGWIQLVISRLDNRNIVIGDCGLNFKSFNQVEFGITIASEHQFKGYAFEALSAIFEYLFTRLNIHRIIGLADKENLGSIKLQYKLGMRKEGEFKESYFDDRLKEWRDEEQFAILKSERKS